MAVSDDDVADSLSSLFRDSNPNSFSSLNDVVLRLQSKLGVLDLSHKLDFIRSQVALFFTSPPPSQKRPATAEFSADFGFPRGGGPTEIDFAGGCIVTNSVPDVPANESSQSRPKKRGGAGGLNKLCGVSPELQAIVGQPAMPRTEIVKQLWAYIRKNNLQDPNNKRKIICNDELRLVFEVDCTDMFQMNKLLAKHILPLNATKESGQQSKKLKAEEVPEAASTETTHVVISEALADLFGTSEREMLQSEVFRHFGEYIKVNCLEDPLNSMVVCDTKLQEILGCESIAIPRIPEMLARNHIFQRSL